MLPERFLAKKEKALNDWPWCSETLKKKAIGQIPSSENIVLFCFFKSCNGKHKSSLQGPSIYLNKTTKIILKTPVLQDFLDKLWSGKQSPAMTHIIITSFFIVYNSEAKAKCA